MARAPGGQLVAKLRVDCTSGDDTGVFSQLATMAPLQGLGIATMLIGAGEQRARARPADFRERRSEEDGHPCARGEWCASADRERLDDGTMRRTPARTYRAFCDTDGDLIGRCLKGFPALHERLSVGDFFTAEVVVRAPFAVP